MRRRSNKPRRTWPQRLLIATNLLLVIACLAAGGFLSFVRQKLQDVQVVSVGLSLAPKTSTDEPQNILIIGTDDADRLAKDDPVRNGRQKGEKLADVIMILRIDPQQQKARLLSIPRDTYVPIEPTGRKSKINSAISGPNGALNLIETIKSNFGISIQHYLEVDFQGFRDLVTVLEGVPIYLTTPVRDTNTGLYLAQTGCITLNPVQALAYARSRHFEYQKNGKWVDDPTSDLGRISRQQDFIRRAGQRAIDQGLRNPSTALSLINAATQAVTLDNTLSVGDIQSIVSRFRSFNVDGLESLQLPTVGGGSASFSYQVVDEGAAEPMLNLFRGVDANHPLAPADVIVDVMGGANATKVATSLKSAGFDAGTSPGATKVPTIRYGNRGAAAAALLARHFDQTPKFVLDPSLVGQRLVLVASDSMTVLAEPRDASSVTAPLDTTGSTTTALSGPTTTTGAGQSPDATSPGNVTTTTAIGVVPVDDKAAAACTG